MNVENVEFPLITVEGSNLVITMPKVMLIHAIEGRSDAYYKVAQPDKLLERFAFHLSSYQESNSVEVGLSELQYLFDKVTDALYESAEDVIINTQEDF